MKKRFWIKLLAPGILLSAFFISCTKSGNLGGATSGGGSFANSMNGSVNGGLSGVANAAITLMIAGSATPLATASTASDGSFNLVFNNPGGNNLLYLSVSGGNAGGGTNSKAQFLSLAGTAGSVLTTLRVNEVTTAATEQVALNFGILTDTNGVLTLSAPKNATVTNNLVVQFNNMIVNGALNTSNANLTTATQNGINVLGNAFASCIETPSSCSNLFNTAVSSTNVAAVSLLESGFNALTNSVNVASPLYTLSFPLSSKTGFILTSSSAPSGFAVSNPLPVVKNTISAPQNLNGVAIDSIGNLWLANQTGPSLQQLSPNGNLLASNNTPNAPLGLAIDANGNVWTANFSGNNVTEFNSSATLIGTFSVGNHPDSIAIDGSGNVWVGQHGGSNYLVTELNSSGTTLQTTTLGASSGSNSDPGVFPDGFGNIWVSHSNTASFSELNSSGMLIRSFTTTGSLQGIAFDSLGNTWAVTGSNTLVEVNSAGNVAATYSSGFSGSLAGISFDQAGNMWIGAYNATQLIEVSPSGSILAVYPVTSGGRPEHVAIDANGNVWSGSLSSTGSNTLVELQAAAAPAFFPYSGPQYPFGASNK